MLVGGKSKKLFKNIFLKMKEDFQKIKSHKLGGIKTLLLKT